MVHRFLLALIGCTFFLGNEVRADLADVLPVGDLERWAAFSLGLNGPGDRLLNHALIDGDLGAAGVGYVALTNNALIQGDLYERRNRLLRFRFGDGITGTEYRDQDALLDQEVGDARAFSKAAGSLTSTRTNKLINLRGSNNLTLSGAPGESVVLNLRSFAMSGSSTLTLTGSATTTYVINVNRRFSLTDSARIVLSGGLDWNDVVFNVRARGSDVQLGGNAMFQGILLATRRSVQMRGFATVRGEVIADALIMQGTTQINHPPVVSP